MGELAGATAGGCQVVYIGIGNATGVDTECIARTLLTQACSPADQVLASLPGYPKVGDSETTWAYAGLDGEVLLYDVTVHGTNTTNVIGCGDRSLILGTGVANLLSRRSTDASQALWADPSSWGKAVVSDSGSPSAAADFATATPSPTPSAAQPPATEAAPGPVPVPPAATSAEDAARKFVASEATGDGLAGFYSSPDAVTSWESQAPAGEKYTFDYCAAGSGGADTASGGAHTASCFFRGQSTTMQLDLGGSGDYWMVVQVYGGSVEAE
jgi:hypothetical protein